VSLHDVVVDTNVLLHADDPRQSHQADAQLVLTRLLKGDASLCVDEGFDLDESRNSSLIGAEYLSHLTATHTATPVIAHLMASGRVTFLPKKTSRAVKQCVDQCVKKPRDRTFLLIAHNSDDQVLCSHDFEDMQPRKRKHLLAAIDVRILESAQVAPLL